MKTVRNENVQVLESTDNTGRIAVLGMILVLTLLVAAAKLVAQAPTSSRGAIRPFVGAYIPTGDQPGCCSQSGDRHDARAWQGGE